MASEIIDHNYRTFRAHQGEALLSEVAATICVLLPRSFTVGGFSTTGEVLLIHHNSYPSDLPEWDKNFFESEILNHPLLALSNDVQAIFIGTNQQLLVPGELYDEEHSVTWLRSIFPVSPSDNIINFNTSRDNAHYLLAVPGEVKAFTSRYFPNAKLLPVTAYQLNKLDQKPGAFLQVLITEEEVYSTMRMNGKIIWHQVFPYTHVADLAWQCAALCKQLHIPVADFRMRASIINDINFDELLELETYFPKMRWTVHARPELGVWEPVVYLMEQLYGCV